MADQLSTTNHDRDTVGKTYVYPVISRRAGGVSVGINLNPNNACNWQCVYCQVPNLVRGSAPKIDLNLLREELDTFLHDLIHGSFMLDRVPEDCRKLCDIAISGNGEPTSCLSFDAVVDVIVDVMSHYDLPDDFKFRLITNGSYVSKLHVQRGLKKMAENHGEVWIKVDSATSEGIQQINGIKASPELLRQQVEIAAKLCPSWIQTCVFACEGQGSFDAEYLNFIAGLKDQNIPIEGVLLYGLARPSMQDNGELLSALDTESLTGIADKIRALDVEVRCS
ncbi:MAG: radical SAM protein [Mariprofundaceae bacterium]